MRVKRPFDRTGQRGQSAGMHARQLLIACVVTVAGPALGAELPTYNTAQYCAAMSAAAVQYRETMIKNCTALENRTRAQLAAVTIVASPEKFRECDAMARNAVGGSYQMLAGCLVTDLADQWLAGRLEVRAR